jgi:hypothetical protein
MIWIVVIIIIGYTVLSFIVNLNKDKIELNSQPLENKLEHLVKILNDSAFEGVGSVNIIDKRSFNLYKQGKNQIINFQYSTGHLTIIWKYKYFTQEVILEKQLPNVRNLDMNAQQRIAYALVEEMERKVATSIDFL